MPIFHALRKSKTAAPKIVLVGNFGAGNVGDELILAGFLKKLSRKLPRARVTVLAADPQLVRRWHGVEAAPFLPTGLRSLLRGGWRKSWQKLRAADSVIFPGGGLFTDSESVRAIILWGVHILVARYFWKPVFLLGQSVGPFHTEIGRRLARACLRRAEWIGTRDSAAVAELARLRIPPEKIKPGEDSSRWLVERIAATKPLKKTGRRKILISVRDFRGIDEKFFAELARALDEISAQKPTRFVFAEFARDDAATARKVMRRAQNGQFWKTAELPESATEVLDFVRQFDLVIGMRLHSLITARLVGVPSVGLSYAPKVAEFQKASGQKSLAVESFKAKKLVDVLKI